MQFVYYLPGSMSTDAFLALRPDVFPGGTACEHKAQSTISDGPDKKAGGLLTWADDAAPARLQNASSLEWDEVNAAGQVYYIGYDPENLPGPDDLIRDDGTSYYDALPLGDGRAWLVPTGRLYPDGSPLPKVRKVRPDGTVVRKVKRKWHSLLKITDEVWEAFETVQDLAPDREAEICRVALSTNYRIGLPEISILELLDDGGVMLILAALTDRYHWPKPGGTE